MADTKISALPNAAVIAAGDLFYTGVSGVSSNSTFAQVQANLTNAAADGATKGIAAFLAADFNSAAGVISIDYTNGQAASAVSKGFLTAADWNTFNTAAGAAPPFTDTNALIKGSADPTKLLRFEVDNITAGATRILSVANQNYTIAGLEVAQTFSQNQVFTPPNDIVPISIAAGSVTGAGTSAFLDIAGTWNTTGAPDAIRLTVTNTASNAAANLLDLMVGASSLFAVRKDGRTTMAGDALIAGALSPAITSVKVNVGIAAAQNVIRINGNSTADNAPVLDFLRSGNREWTFAPISNSFFISNSGGVANFNDATLNATPNWEFTSLGALKLNGGTVATGLLHVNTDTTGAGLTIFEQASADTDDYDLSFRKTRGTVAVPSAITVGDKLGSILFRGYSGAAGYVTASSIRAVSTGTIATTRVSSSLVFATGTDVAPTVLTDRLTIDNVGTSTFTPGGNAKAIAVTGHSLTGADASSMVDLAGTWNTSGAPIAFKVNITNTASSGAFLADLQIGSTSIFAFTAGSVFRIQGATTILPRCLIGLTTDTSARIEFGLDATDNPRFGFGPGGASARDVFFVREASAVFGINNTTTAAQTLRIYETSGTTTSPTNYSRLNLQTQAGNHLIRTEAAGTGTLRILQVGTGPSTGTDIAGISTILHGGQATGSGAAGAILFQQSLPVGGTGAGVTALATTASFTTTGLFSTLFSSLIRNATAIPAGGTAGSGYMFSSTSNFGVFFGSGAPSLVAAKGSLYLRSDGGGTGDRAYIATDSAGAWTAITTAT